MEANIINDNFVHDSNYKRIYIKQNMDYEEKYKKTLEKARKELQACGSVDCDAAKQIFRFFPELAESEDERIRKDIIVLVKDWWDRVNKDNISTKEQMIAWLEKQGEQKHICKLDNSYARVKFPFKAKVKSSGTIVMIHDGQLSPDGKEWIKYQSDKEDGYKIYEPNNLELVCEIEQKPAEKKELKKIEHKPAWSEEDEHWRQKVIDFIKHLDLIKSTPTLAKHTIDWLESLKNRVALRNSGNLRKSK